MKKDDRINLFDFLRGEFKSYDSVIDLGFGSFEDLYNLENSPFKKLLGIDNDPDEVLLAVERYKHWKKGNAPDDQVQPLRNNLLREQFNKRFKLEEGDVKTFHLKPEEYSFIICSQVLHFFPDNEKLELIERFYQSLQPGGLMFLRMVHCNDPFNKTLIQIEHCVFKAPPKEGEGPPLPRYTIEPVRFIQNLASYNILSQYTQKTNSSFYFVIKKP